MHAAPCEHPATCTCILHSIPASAIQPDACVPVPLDVQIAHRRAKAWRLQVKDDPSTQAFATVRTLGAWSDPFWASNERQLSAQLGGVDPARVPELRRRSRRLQAAAEAGLRGYEDFAAAGEQFVLRKLAQDDGGGDPDDRGPGGPRQQQTRLFHMFYRYADNSTAVTDAMVEFVRTFL